jgi:hypothetical protein
MADRGQSGREQNRTHNPATVQLIPLFGNPLYRYNSLAIENLTFSGGS